MPAKPLSSGWVRSLSLGALLALVPALSLGCVAVITPEGEGSGAESDSGSGAAPGSSSSGGAGGSAGVPTVESTDPGSVALRRLNIAEFDNTLRDLFGTEIRLPASFPPDARAAGFDNVASVQSVTDVHLGHYRNTVRAVVEEALDREPRLAWLECVGVEELESCLTGVLESFLPRAYRRPVADGEVSTLVALSRSLRDDGAEEREAAALTLEAALLSPNFLYLFELDADPSSLEPRALSAWELAARLSYFLHSSLPDEELAQAAASGALLGDAELSAQVERLLRDPKAIALVDNFASQWLPLRELARAAPDPELFPSFDEELRDAMLEETRRVFGDVLAGTLTARDLLLTGSTYLNDRLAQHYGLPLPGSVELVETDVGGGERGGLLTQASFLSVYAHPTETSPVLRGKWVLSQLLCEEIGAPPAGIPPEPSPVTGQSRRERLAAHRKNPSCSACHAKMDPIGLALENYDAVGAYRTVELGAPIDPAGELPDGRTFSGVRELSEIIADDPAFPACLAKQAFVYALGRDVMPSTMDERVLQQVTTAFENGGFELGSLFSAIALSSPFRMRRGYDAVQGGAP